MKQSKDRERLERIHRSNGNKPQTNRLCWHNRGASMDLNRRRCVAISSRIVQRLLYQSHRTPSNQTALTKHSRTVSSNSISFHPIHRIGHTSSTYPVSQGLNSGIQKRNNIEHGNDDAEGCQRLVRHCSCLVFDPIYDKSLSLESKKRRCVCAL